MRNSWAPRVVTLVVLSAFFMPDVAFGRIRWPERNRKPVLLSPRRFGLQNPAFLDQLGSACPGQFCGVLAGSGPATLLANAPECAQQDLADKIIGQLQFFAAVCAPS